MIIFIKNDKTITDIELIEKYSKLETPEALGRLDRMKLKFKELWSMIDDFKVM